MNNVCVMLVYLQNDFISRWFKQQINYIEKANKEHYQRNSESIKPLHGKMIHCFEALQSDRESFVSERDFKARFANHLIQSGTSKRVSRIICFERDFKARFEIHLFQSGTSSFEIHLFRAGLQSAFRDSFVSSGTSKRVSRLICFERDFKARFATHLFRATSKRVSRLICFERDFKARFANHLFSSRTSKRVSRLICFERDFKARFATHLFRAGLQSAFRESFVSERDFKARESFVYERDFKARFATHLISSGTSKRVSRLICFERDFKARFANHLFPSGTSKRVSRIICFRAGLQIINQRQGCRGSARGGLRGLKPRMFLLHALYASSSLSFHAH